MCDTENERQTHTHTHTQRERERERERQFRVAGAFTRSKSYPRAKSQSPLGTVCSTLPSVLLSDTNSSAAPATVTPEETERQRVRERVRESPRGSERDHRLDRDRGRESLLVQRVAETHHRPAVQ